jgi:hypothetical protein
MSSVSGFDAPPHDDERMHRWNCSNIRANLAFDEQLPLLLQSHLGQWAAYVDDRRAAIASALADLRDECRAQGLDEDEYHVFQIVPDETIEVD